MMRIMMKSKIHQAVVKDANLNYKGSITIDEDLLKAADIMTGERVQIVNLNNGARFETYAIPAPAKSGMICINGGAARLCNINDKVIIISYGIYNENELKNFQSKVIMLDEANRIK